MGCYSNRDEKSIAFITGLTKFGLLIPLLTANAEVIVPVPLLEDVKSARVSVFYDAGNVFASDDSFALSELRMAVGVAGIWMSPMGLLSVSYSNPFNDQLGDEIEKFQFNFGTQF